jgi:hypothetical protein
MSSAEQQGILTASPSAVTGVSKKIDAYIHSFKLAIHSHLGEYKKRNGGVNTIDEFHTDLMEMVTEYDKFTVCGDDLVKRKRVKNSVPLFDRCIAKRANGEQCTRRKKEGEGYCGTHIKGRPHGSVNETAENMVTNKKVEVWVQEIKGIVYYVDADKNVYDPEDILVNKVNPRVIMKLE